MTADRRAGVDLAQLRPGAVVHIDGQASVQFGGERALRLRLVAVDDRPTYYGWVWLTGYVLGPGGDAVAKRELYVQLGGLRLLAPAPAVVQQQRRAAAPVRVRA
ncbi:hypothetical protein [Micromonospora sp. RTGN7]|uniref:hypothetical protein n=1 Tax=Micromonospora sp. RTGN7 TaxID=3016526 RepID=UPI0029FEDAD1|nr:hypothetical protein [Micromonospora sp. RTGN7]